MASLQEYCEKMPTGTLEDIIFGDLSGYPTEVILTVCDVLLDRQPDRPDVQQIMQQLLADLGE